MCDSPIILVVNSTLLWHAKLILLREPVEVIPVLVCAVTAALVATYPEAFIVGNQARAHGCGPALYDLLPLDPNSCLMRYHEQ